MSELDFTHNPDAESWVDSANQAETDFPIQNLPFGVFSEADDDQKIGVAIGDQILDLHHFSESGLIEDPEIAMACQATALNGLMALSKSKRIALRQQLSQSLSRDNETNRGQMRLVAQSDVTMRLPCEIRDYTDFYASVFHATNVGSMFRPNNPLLPNYKHIPIGYHGRASSIVPSGTKVKRPAGQKAPTEEGGNPTRSPSALFDYEFEVGFFVAEGNELGSTISIDEAESKIFGMVLVNDWSARDLQKWEYQPLGPFLAKSFATSISCWVVTMEALAPFRCAEFQRPDDDPRAQEYLSSDANAQTGGVGITLAAKLASASMRKENLEPQSLSNTSFTNMYWTIAQMLTHHSSNGCNLQPGDLLASGTVSGPTRSERGCLLELTWNGDLDHPVPGTDRTPIELPTGEERKFLADGDEVILEAFCDSDSHRRIGFGCCKGIVLPASE
ncbi:MAG: fumarylacetoacetase [Planctomycetota bacterium]